MCRAEWRKGKLRKRLVSIYAKSGVPQPSGSAMLEVECSIEVHVQPAPSLISDRPEGNLIHLTENHLLPASTTTPTVTTRSAKEVGDTLEMDYGPAKSTLARSTSARTFAAAYNANDLTGMQMSQLHAALQPTQTDVPDMLRKVSTIRVQI